MWEETVLERRPSAAYQSLHIEQMTKQLTERRYGTSNSSLQLGENIDNASKRHHASECT